MSEPSQPQRVVLVVRDRRKEHALLGIKIGLGLLAAIVVAIFVLAQFLSR